MGMTARSVYQTANTSITFFPVSYVQRKNNYPPNTINMATNAQAQLVNILGNTAIRWQVVTRSQPAIYV